MFPLRKVVLFKHGVGYFERQRTVTDDSSVDFFFKEVQMNDVLKSLTAVDIGGAVSSISYQTQTPINKQLDSLSLKLSDGKASLTELLHQSIGAQIVITMKTGEQQDGCVVALDYHNVAKKENDDPVVTGTRKTLHLLTEDCTLISIPLDSIRCFVYKDPSLRQDLQHLMDTMLNIKKKDLKRVTLFARGSSTRTLVASYVIESPVWKTSYRLQLALSSVAPAVHEEGAISAPPGQWKSGTTEEKQEKKQEEKYASGEGEGEKKGEKHKHLLQGWCLVDNTQDEDWTNVTLTLIGGRPNAFKHDLYAPRFRKRPMLQVQEVAPPRPPVLEDVLPHHTESLLRSAPALLSSLDIGGPKIGEVPTAPKIWEPSIAEKEYQRPQQQMKQETIRQVKPVDVFQYVIPKPVTVKRGQSALVPFLSAEFQGESCSLYNEGVNATNPLSVIFFVNTFGVTLDSGPLTIYDEDTCIGETMLESIRPNDDKFLPYGVDKQVTVTVTSTNVLGPVSLTKIRNAQLTISRYRIFEKKYAFDHKGSTHINSLYIEHKFFKGDDYSLYDTAEPHSKTENFLRFKTRVNAAEITIFRVKERKLEHTIYSLRNVESKEIEDWYRLKYISKSTRDAFINEFIPLRRKIEQQQKMVNELTAQLTRDISTQQSTTSSLTSRLQSSSGNYFYGGNQLWYYNEVSDDVVNQTQLMINREESIRKLRSSTNVENEKLTQDRNKFETGILKIVEDNVLNETANFKYVEDNVLKNI